MTAAELLKDIRARGFVLWTVGGQLFARGPEADLPEVLQRLQPFKWEVCALLSCTYRCSSCGQFHFGVPTVCYWCRRRRPEDTLAHRLTSEDG